MRLLVERPLLVFLALTFALSLGAGLLAFHIGGEKTFENPKALPFLLLTIWSPNIAALFVSYWEKTTSELLPGATVGAPALAWLLAAIPLFVAGALFALGPAAESPPLKLWPLLIGMNLIMGPLGEELGWRAFLLARLNQEMTPFRAALVVGAIWAAWHFPLWLLPSPHRDIPFPVFALTVVCFSLLLAVIWRISHGAIWPCVAFHLAANVGVGFLEASGGFSGSETYVRSLPAYLFTGALAGLWLARLPAN